MSCAGANQLSVKLITIKTAKHIETIKFSDWSRVKLCCKYEYDYEVDSSSGPI